MGGGEEGEECQAGRVNCAESLKYTQEKQANIRTSTLTHLVINMSQYSNKFTLFGLVL